MSAQAVFLLLIRHNTWLHASDVKKIMSLLDSFVDNGNTVILIAARTIQMQPDELSPGCIY